MLPKEFAIVPINFKLDEPLLMKNKDNLNLFEAYTNATYKIKPQFKIDKSDGVSVKPVVLSCPGLGFFKNESQPFIVNGVWQMNIQYSMMPSTGPGTLMTCTLKITASDKDIPPVELQFPTLKW